ncbi:hypothetical protein, partial [Sutterella wadsworthensis]|uniref:hypothetical protein n=1 Tax=Sutterella wadsworthensis TaxID=40545 RepID=UPI003A908202
SKKLFALSTKQTLHVQAMKSKLNLPVSRDKGKFILTEVKKKARSMAGQVGLKRVTCGSR